MSNDTAKTVTTNIVPVQGTFEPLPPYECINLIGPAGTPFFAPVNPNLDGVSITNSTINSTTIGATTPSTAAFTTATMSNQPVGNLDLCNKTYVDAAIVGISWKQPVRAATTANITLSGAQTIDTVAVVAGDRVLVKEQTAQAENGIYIVGTPWTRSPDADVWEELVSAMVFIESGGLAGAAFYCPVQPGGTLGVTAVTWSNFSVAGTYFAGTGLSLAANTFSITNTAVTPASYGSGSQVATFTVNAQGQLTAAANASIAIDASAITSGTINTARISGDYSGITGVGTLTNLTVTNTITGSISGNAATATSATSATTATNLAGGASGNVPYQTGSGATTFLATGSDGQVLTLASGVPSWATPTVYGDVVGPASSVDNQIARFDGITGKVIQTASPTISDAGAIQNINELNFDVTPTSVAGGQGSLSWNSSEGTLDLVMKGGNVTQHIGEEIFYTARNATGSTINKAVPVYASGVTAGSNRIEVSPMIADGSIDELRFVGMTSESISNGVNGLVTDFGYIRNIDTSGTPYSQTWAAGDIIYVSATAAGGLTNVQPVAPNLKIVVALVINADNNFGVLLVRPTAYPQINDLSNVNISTVTGGDLLVYDGTDARWENAAQSTITAGKATNLAGGAAGSLPYQSAADTTTFLAAGSDGQVLKLASGVPTWSSDASGVTITDDTTTNATRYITFSNLTTGNETTLDVSSTKLTYNPSTGVLAATTFSGSGASLTSVVNSITGTSNQVIASASTGAVTLSLPQSIATSSSVQFGSFGVGTAASGTTGEIRATNNVTAFYSSDKKFKENITDIDGALDKVSAIGGKYFDWTDEYIAAHGGEDGYFVNKSDFGVIAQDVQQAFPVAVKTREDGSLAVDYEKLCSLAFAAIKELKSRIEKLEG
jgi:hypothetical protein